MLIISLIITISEIIYQINICTQKHCAPVLLLCIIKQAIIDIQRLNKCRRKKILRRWKVLYAGSIPLLSLTKERKTGVPRWMQEENTFFDCYLVYFQRIKRVS
jgi:hypothetical protein